ncbi:MAG: PilZ domain-containing protein [Labilithrix sp.]|nr:PilZ domain-containing protein [Labilithrix sp.]
MSEPVRRAFRRFVRLDCEVVREHDFKVIGDLALDLSTRGMLVRATSRVLTGEEIVVTFRPPRCNTYLDAVGTVARVVHGRRPGDTGLSFGIEFHAIEREHEQLIFEHLRGMFAPEPMRPPRPLVTRARAA